MQAEGLTRKLAAQAAAYRYDALPAEAAFMARQCLLDFLGVTLAGAKEPLTGILHEEALAEVTEFFKSRGRELTELNRLQAALPVCCEKITNKMGTAPGMWFQRNGKVFVSMPGERIRCLPIRRGFRYRFY